MFQNIRYVGFILVCLTGFVFNVSGNDITALGLMPMPHSVELKEGSFVVDANFKLGIQGNAHPRIYAAATRFLRQLDSRTGLYLPQGYITAKSDFSNAQFQVIINRPGVVALHEEEAYALSIEGNKIVLEAETDIGAIRGFETLLQLLDNKNGNYYFPSIEIKDAPRFPWRGLMIDVARHFQPMEVIKRNLDAMAAVKLNVLHLHLTDDQGFRVEVKSHPKLHENGSDGQYFTQEEIKTIIRYADDRGIRVVPEFDVPGHATAWLLAYPEIGSTKNPPTELQRFAGIFDPTLDPTNEKTYQVLNEVFTEMAALFPDPYFHIGGDENEGKHWDANQNIQAFMKKKGLESNHDLQTYFNTRLLKTLTGLNKKMMGWDEILQPALPKSAVIQSWRGKEGLFQAAKAGHQTVLSNGYYIDLLKHAKDHYLVDPLPENSGLTTEEKKNILGGEATMWSELVTPVTIDSRIWPRTAAIAERFWSAREVKDVADMYRRLEIINGQLEYYGITHKRNKAFIVRNLANGQDTAPIETLLGVVEPMKGYTRNAGGTMHKSFNPFTKWADAANTDAKEARAFGLEMEKFLTSGYAENGPEIESRMQKWYNNHEQFVGVVQHAPILKPVEALSFNLKAVAAIGLELLESIKNNKPLNKEWFVNNRILLEKAKEQGGRTTLEVVEPIELLFLKEATKTGAVFEEMKAQK